MLIFIKTETQKKKKRKADKILCTTYEYTKGHHTHFTVIYLHIVSHITSNWKHCGIEGEGKWKRAFVRQLSLSLSLSLFAYYNKSVLNFSNVCEHVTKNNGFSIAHQHTAHVKLKAQKMYTNLPLYEIQRTTIVTIVCIQDHHSFYNMYIHYTQCMENVGIKYTEKWRKVHSHTRREK